MYPSRAPARAAYSAALKAFDERYVPEMARALQRLRLSANSGDRDHAAAPPGALPCDARVSHLRLRCTRGAAASGPGRRVTTTRKGLRALRRSTSDAGDESELLAARSPGDDPELAYLKSLYGEAFRAAFLVAVDALETRDKNVLRQHFIDNLTIDDLATLYRVHRATAARWITTARKNLLTATRREFSRQADVGALECESVLRLLQSRLDVTWQRLLA